MDIVIVIVILLFSAIIHEVMHGVVAEKLGDDTARLAGRITLNPIPHIDPFGSILLPALMWIATGGRFVFASAKPVPVNFNNLKNPKVGTVLVSLAGPLSNLALAVIFALLIKFKVTNAISLPIFYQAVVLNLLLATFNLIPIPPLDGSKVLAALGSRKFMNWLFTFERYGFILILLFLYSGLLSYLFVPILIAFWRIFGLDSSAL